jgi:hypothetical protein
MLPTGQTIEWYHWVKAYEWDRRNPIQIHKKLTREHIELNSKTKMRNHLAEEVIHLDMLQLMREYQISEGINGFHRNGSIEFLKITQQLVSLFRDPRPISDISDIRLDQM